MPYPARSVPDGPFRRRKQSKKPEKTPDGPVFAAGVRRTFFSGCSFFTGAVYQSRLAAALSTRMVALGCSRRMEACTRGVTSPLTVS